MACTQNIEYIFRRDSFRFRKCVIWKASKLAFSSFLFDQHITKKTIIATQLLFTFVVSEDASVGGTYTGIEPMGLLWSLRPIPGSRTGLR